MPGKCADQDQTYLGKPDTESISSHSPRSCTQTCYQSNCFKVLDVCTCRSSVRVYTIVQSCSSKILLYWCLDQTSALFQNADYHYNVQVTGTCELRK